MRRFRLGIDVGTTRVKAVVIDEKGDIVRFASQGLRLYAQDSCVEEDPEEIWDAVVKVVREVTADEKIKSGLVGLSLSTQGGTLILVDQEGRPLRRAITWMDTRALRESDRLLKEFGAAFFYQITGWIPKKICLPLSQLIWLYANERELFRRIHKSHFVDSYLIYMLTGREFIDYTNASITMLFDIRKRKWSEELLKLAKITEQQLPIPIPSGKRIGRLTEQTAKLMDLPLEVSVFSGGHDQYCSAYGASVRKPGEVLLSTGTAWVILAITEQPVFSPKFEFSPGPHIVDGLWGALTSIPYGGASYDWFLKEVLLNRMSYEEAEEMVRNAKGDIPVFRPFLTRGRRYGEISKISLSHTAGHILKAIMTGIALEVRRKLQAMQSSGIPIREIRMVGGCAKSSIWPEIVSEILALPVTIPPILETASLGSALLVKMGDETDGDVF